MTITITMDRSNILQKIDDFFQEFPPTNFKKGEVILATNSDPVGIFYLKRGFVRQYLYTERGSELTLHFFKAGSFFPLFWAINELPNKYYYQALTEVQTRIAPKEKFLEFIKPDPEILFNLSSKLLFGLHGLLTRVESLASADARERTIGIILFLGKHFGIKAGNSLSLSYSFTHEDIANLTGLSRETTSRELEGLAKQGLIVIRKRLISVPDVSKLR